MYIKNPEDGSCYETELRADDLLVFEIGLPHFKVLRNDVPLFFRDNPTDERSLIKDHCYCDEVTPDNIRIIMNIIVSMGKQSYECIFSYGKKVVYRVIKK
jgi:hypothetical protein